MNYIMYNGTIIQEDNFIIQPTNRAFCYGDGLFETIVYKEGKLLYIEDHLNRISKGLLQLAINLPKGLTISNLSDMVKKLVIENKLHNNARVKLQVWRKPGGLITPESSEADYTIVATELKKPIEVKVKALISENIKLYPTNLSKFKTLNFLPYIQAGIEKKKRAVDEIILTDLNGNLAEASSSNIFWAISDNLFTPALETGCIEGIMRKQIINYCKEENITIKEGLFPVSLLNQAELVFTSNVTGLSLIENINNSKINTQYTIYQSIKIGLDLI